MLFGKSQNYLVRTFLPAALSPSSGEYPPEAMLDSIAVVAVKTKSIEAGAAEACNVVAGNKGFPFLVYHIPGKHSPSSLLAKLKSGESIERVIVWEDRNQMTLFDMIVDYTDAGGSKNDALKIKAYTLEEGVAAARGIISHKGGVASAIQHIPGDHTVEELRGFAEGKEGCITRLVWFNESEMYESASPEELFMAMTTELSDAEKVSTDLLFRFKGTGSPGVFMPPAREAM